MACRVPEYFNTTQKLYEHNDNNVLRELVETEESWETQIQKMGEVGQEIKSDITREDMKKFVDKELTKISRRSFNRKIYNYIICLK